jgi:hypothetical protein
LTELQRKHQKMIFSVKDNILFLMNKFSNKTDFFGKLIATTLIFEVLFVLLVLFSNSKLESVVLLIFSIWKLIKRLPSYLLPRFK